MLWKKNVCVFLVVLNEKKKHLLYFPLFCSLSPDSFSIFFLIFRFIYKRKRERMNKGKEKRF